MSKADVIAIRDASQGWKQAVRYQKEANSPWGAHFVEMGRKTVLRRLFKFLPVSIELATAATLDAKAATGETQGAFEDVLQGEYTVATDDGAPADDGAGVDATTGEITGASAGAAPAETTRSALTAEQVRERLAKATDVDLLDADADLIREIGDTEQRAALTDVYRARREELTASPASTAQAQAQAGRRARSSMSME
jgi:recombination protein RecT